MSNTKIVTYYKNYFLKYSIWRTIGSLCILIAVVLFLDINDIPSRFKSNELFFYIEIVVGLFLLLSILQENKVFQIGKIFPISVYDFILNTCIIFFSTYLVLINILDIIKPYKIIILCIVFVGSIIILTHRIKKYDAYCNRSKDYKPNDIDLKDLYENNFEIANGLVVLNEKEVDYDLLERKTVINYLYNILVQCKPQKSFVISLEGKWGSGKTTILKNVKTLIKKNNKDIVVVDDFDPWNYGTEISMIENLFECILKGCDIKVNATGIRDSILSITKAVVASEDRRAGLEELFLQKRSVKESKKSINECFDFINKKIVVYIDNLDRLDEEKIIFLFKVIANVVDFNKVIYVIAFDSEKIKNVFEKKPHIDYSYLEKVIQLQIKLPEIDKSVISNIVVTSTQNILSKYGQKVDDYAAFIDLIKDDISDIRKYKRVFNSLIMKSLHNKLSISKRDLLVLEYIKMNNLELYKEIYSNSKYFISEGDIYDKDLFWYRFNKDDYKREQKDYFEKLFSKDDYKKYEKLLIEIFPTVEEYSKTKFYPREKFDRNIEKTRGIANAKYFPLYFSETENEFSILGGMVERFIHIINNASEEAMESFCIILKKINSELHRELMEAIYCYIDEVDKNSLLKLAEAIFMQYTDISNEKEFMLLDARKRATVIIWELLQKITEDEYDEFILKMSKAYNKLFLIVDIAYWFESNHNNINVQGRKEKWNKLKENLAKEVVSNNINLYEDSVYISGNIWGLYHALNKDGNVFKQYIKFVCTDETFFRIMKDIMGESIGTGGYSYYYNGDTIKIFFEYDEIEERMKSIFPKSEDEKFIVEVYEKYKKFENTTSVFEKGISFKEPKVINV